jgi:predicted dehydrogenase
MSLKPVKVGVIGCGNISGLYLQMMPEFEILRVAACADILTERAQAKAQECSIRCAGSVEELLEDPEIELIVNITIPQAHYEVALAAIQAGKSVWNEKPLSITRDEGRKLVETAREKGVLVGCAPDTFLGAGLQTCIKLIDDGWIGEPVGATAFFMSGGPEHWHPDPAFIYKVGAGPMFDMGPYYLTALVALLGPVRRVCGSARITYPERTITSQPKYGQKMVVEVPTYVTGTLDFAAGPVGTIITTFDVAAAELPRIEIYGSAGTLSCPDPNSVGGPVRLRRAGSDEWSSMPLTHGYSAISRSIGVADMAYALRTGRPHRASGDLAYHVLDIMHSVHDASGMSRYVELTSGCARPEPLPLGLRDGVLDE